MHGLETIIRLNSVENLLRIGRDHGYTAFLNCHIEPDELANCEDKQKDQGEKKPLEANNYPLPTQKENLDKLDVSTNQADKVNGGRTMKKSPETAWVCYLRDALASRDEAAKYGALVGVPFYNKNVFACSPGYNKRHLSSCSG
jgi:hypothetical protein